MTKKAFIFPVLFFITVIIFFWGDKLKTVFSPIIAALILTYIATPFVNLLSKRIPKILAAVLFYVLTLGVCILLVSFIMPTFLSALKGFIDYLPELASQINKKIPFSSIPLSSVTGYLSTKADSVSDFIKEAFSFLTSATFAIILSCFFLMDTSFLKKGFSAVLPERITEKFLPAVREIDSVFKGFFRGQMFVSLFLSALTFIFLIILRIKHAFILSLIYGIFCLVPAIGPFIGGVPIVLIAYLTSPLSAILSFFAVLLTQFIENTFLSPKIKADSVDISPASAFISVYLGAAFFGFSGVIFGIPFFASIKIILRRILSAIS